MMKSNVIFFGVCVEKFATIDLIIFSFFSLSVTLLAPFLRYFFFFLVSLELFYSQKQQKQKARKR